MVLEGICCYCCNCWVPGMGGGEVEEIQAQGKKRDVNKS